MPSHLDVPLGLIDLGPTTRAPADREAAVEAVRRSIEKNGFLYGDGDQNRLLVVREGDRYRLLRGVIRYLALLDLGWETAPCRVLHPSEVEGWDPRGLGR